MAGMPSRGIPTTYPAPPFEPDDSGLICPKPSIPVPCSSVIFSSRVITFTTIAARSSSESLGSIHGPEGFCGFCEKRDRAEPARREQISKLREPRLPNARLQIERCIVFPQGIFTLRRKDTYYLFQAESGRGNHVSRHSPAKINIQPLPLWTPSTFAISRSSRTLTMASPHLPTD